MNGITTNEYIAVNNPGDAIEILAKYGLQPVSNVDNDIARALDVLVQENGEEGLKDVMSIHPDKEYFVHFNKKSTSGNKHTQQYEHESGLGHLSSYGRSIGNMFHSAGDNHTLLLVGGIIAAAIIISSNKG